VPTTRVGDNGEIAVGLGIIRGVMCGLVGYLDLRGRRAAELRIVEEMGQAVEHRGPDSWGSFLEDGTGLGFRRLQIIDLASGEQPMHNEDGSLVLACNGEIFNYRELRAALLERGHRFRTSCDVEVLLHLYEERGAGLLDEVNGQFAFALYDRRRRTLLLARDHFGINPLFYAVFDGVLIFASEIKSILRHPLARREVDLTGLDQVFSFPGLVSPRTLFKDVHSLPGGRCLWVEDGAVCEREYWDLDYPLQDEAAAERPEAEHVERLAEAFRRSVELRLRSDVEVGFYLSGGLDSSLIAAVIHQLTPAARRHSFSILFGEREISEERYQRMMAERVASIHHEIPFDWSQIAERLRRMIYHCECPVKETYNTCSLAMSQAARQAGVKVVLTGEGADELFAGYVGYRFDQHGPRRPAAADPAAALEAAARQRLWGVADLFYEEDHHAARSTKLALYSRQVAALFGEFDSANFPLVDGRRLRGRHPLHQRSYLDFKLRLADHLLGDHGDRMAMANSIEARFPFLDLNLVRVATEIPPSLKLRGLDEKYILKRVAEPLLPPRIVKREKFGFRAPGTPYLLQRGVEWVADMLSCERIRRSGYFDPQAVAGLRTQYSRPGFVLELPFDTDLLAVVLSFEILREEFDLPCLG
jgi:asparagine synthase (glutamine-hydrolysing)